MSTFFRKKNEGGKKTDKKQQFSWKNDMVDDLISSLECFNGFKALLEWRAFWLWQSSTIHSILQREPCKKCEGFGPAELPKTANDDDYTDLEKQKQNIKEAEKQIETGY